MYSKLHRPQKDERKVSQNAGSCVKLAYYLEKESGKEKAFFSHTQNCVGVSEVVNRIDNNKRTLKKWQDKFYMLSYNPSQSEIAHLIKRLTGKDVKSLDDLLPGEKKIVLDEFRDYVRDCMNVYARNFNRDKELSADDLVYFGRIEEFRYYTHEDIEVKEGFKKRGELKEGLNLHAHVIVSRMDVTQKIALSPLSKSRGSTNQLNGKEVKNGFHMQGWQIDCFELFSNKYRYIPPVSERFYYNNKSYSYFKHRIQNNIMNEVLEGMNEEIQVISSARKITAIIHPSKRSVRMYLLRKIKNILIENDSVV